MNWVTRLPLFGMSGGGGFVTSRLLIHDTFTGLGTNNLSGWEPDAINVPGNAWTEQVAGRNQGNGAGQVIRDTDIGTARIDTEVVNGAIRVDMDVTFTTDKERFLIALLAPSHYNVFNGSIADNNALEIEHAAGSDTLNLQHRIDGIADSPMASVSVPRTIGETHSYRFLVQESLIQVFFDDEEIAGLRQEDYEIPGAIAGNSFIGTGGNAPTLWDNVRVWSLQP